MKITLSINCSLIASVESNCLPDGIKSSEAFKLVRRGSRNVAEPGMTPIFTSGNPNLNEILK